MCSSRLCLLWLFSGIIFNLYAQYEGGDGDGFRRSFANATTLNNQDVAILYQGNNGDGYHQAELYAITLDNSSLSAVFSGGNGDGFDRLIFNTVTLNNTTLSDIYSGGNGDGYSLNNLSATTLNSTLLLELYSGGNGDGFDVSQLFSITLDSTSLVALFSGGNGDGYSYSNLDNVTLTNLLLSALYDGGNGDGFTVDQAVAYLDPNAPCVRLAQLVGTPTTSDFQISSTSNSGNSTPQDLNNAFLVLRSKEKGFVITRMPDPETAIGSNAVEGMIVYDSDDECIKLYNGMSWNCIIQRCPD